MKKNKTTIKNIKTSKKYKNMIEAYKAFWKRGFKDWKGTSSVSEYFWSSLMNTIIIIASLCFSFLFVALEKTNEIFAIIGFVFLLVCGTFCLISLIPALSLVIRRFHDFGQPSWVPIILIIATIITTAVFKVDLSIIIVSLCFIPTKVKNNPYHKYNKD